MDPLSANESRAIPPALSQCITDVLGKVPPTSPSPDAAYKKEVAALMKGQNSAHRVDFHEVLRASSRLMMRHERRTVEYHRRRAKLEDAFIKELHTSHAGRPGKTRELPQVMERGVRMQERRVAEAQKPIQEPETAAPSRNAASRSSTTSERPPEPIVQPPAEPDASEVTETIEYAEVYGDGTNIQDCINRPKGWRGYFIVRCQPCGLRFKQAHPTHWAGLHWRDEHGYRGPDPSVKMVVARFGLRVLNCNERRQKANNDKLRLSARAQRNQRPSAATEDREREASPPPSQTTPRRERAPNSRNPRGFHSITNPKIGRIYTAYCENGGRHLPVLLLPLQGDFFSVNLPGSLATSTQLLRNVPPCYSFDVQTAVLNDAWQPGYEDGGPKMLERQFAALYFETDQTSAQPSLWEDTNWVAAKNLGAYELSMYALPSQRAVTAYLERIGPPELTQHLTRHDADAPAENGQVSAASNHDERMLDGTKKRPICIIEDDDDDDDDDDDESTLIRPENRHNQAPNDRLAEAQPQTKREKSPSLEPEHRLDDGLLGPGSIFFGDQADVDPRTGSMEAAARDAVPVAWMGDDLPGSLLPSEDRRPS